MLSFLLKIFSKILNFNPQPKNPALAVCGPHQLMLNNRQSSQTPGNEVPFLTPHSTDSDQSVDTIIP